jgi:hypothetical protein
MNTASLLLLSRKSFIHIDSIYPSERAVKDIPKSYISASYLDVFLNIDVDVN